MRHRVVMWMRRLQPVALRLAPRVSLSVRLRLQRRLGYLEPEFELLPLLADPERISVDAGANSGVFTLALSRLSRWVHAFEPIPPLADALRRTGLRRVEVHAVALSDAAGRATLEAPVIDGQVRHTRASLDASAGERVRYEVELVTLDGLELGDVGFIKIDVEGAELRLLRGAERTVQQSRPNLMVEVEAGRVLDGTLEDVFALLDGWGYEGWFYAEAKRRPIAEFSVDAHQAGAAESFKHTGYVNNFVFVPRERPVELPERLSRGR